MEGAFFLAGGGRAADAIYGFDWAATPLGPISGWPQVLKTVLGLMLSSSFPKAIAWGPTYITFHNDAFESILGDKPDAIGRPFDKVWAEAWPALEPIVDRAFAGEPTFIENFPLTINRHGYPEEAFFTFCYSAIRDERGEVAGMMDTVVETTETILAQRKLAMINGELAHRMRNLLTMATAIANMSLRDASSLEAGRVEVTGRLIALGQAQELLMADAKVEANVPDLIASALAPHAGFKDQIRARGPTCQLKAKESLALSLALNELLTNSIKYGALSDGGEVQLEWVERAAEEFRFTWHETGGPPPGKSDRVGFGTTLLMQFVPASFQGEARRELGKGSLKYELVARRRAGDEP